MRFLRYGPGRVQKGSQNGLRMTLPGPPQTGPQMALRSPYAGPQISYAQNKALFDTLLTIAELKDVSSKDWIRAPT